MRVFLIKDLINEAIGCALEAKRQWEDTPYEHRYILYVLIHPHKWFLIVIVHRAAVFLRMADLISTKYRYQVIATTMLGQVCMRHECTI